MTSYSRFNQEGGANAKQGTLTENKANFLWPATQRVPALFFNKKGSRSSLYPHQAKR